MDYVIFFFVLSDRVFLNNRLHVKYLKLHTLIIKKIMNYQTVSHNKCIGMYEHIFFQYFSYDNSLKIIHFVCNISNKNIEPQASADDTFCDILRHMYDSYVLAIFMF